MNCGEFESRLNDWLDGLQPELNFAAAAHARRCPRCAELLAGHEMLMAGLASLPLPEPSADFSFRVLDEVTVRRPAASPRVSWAASVASWGAPAAAAVLVGVVALLRTWFAPVAEGPGAIAKSRASEAAATPRYMALLRETGLTGATFSAPAWMDQVTDGLRPLPTSMGAVLMAQPLTSPMGAALLALNSTAPGA